MSARGLEEFPPHWEPPLRIGYGEAEPDVFDLLEIVTRETPSSWLRGVVVEKILFQSNANAFTHDRLINLSEVDEADLETYVELLKSAPNGSKLAASHQFEIDRIFQDADDPEAFVILSVVFVSNLQAAKAFQPGECAFDSPADAVVTSIPQGQRTGDLLIHAAAIGSNQTNVFEQQCCALSIGTCQSLLEFHGVCFWVSHG